MTNLIFNPTYFDSAPIKKEKTYNKKESVQDFDIRALRIDGELTSLSVPLKCSLYKEGKSCIIENNYLGIVAYGNNKKEAIEDFEECFSYCVKEYMECDDGALSPNAIRIKNKLKGYLNASI